MNLQLIISFFIILHLRKSLQTASQFPGWNKILIALLFACIALQATEISFRDTKLTIIWLSHIIILSITGIIYSKKIFYSARSTMTAVLPLVLVSFLSDLLELINADVYTEWEKLFDTAQLFSLIWMVTMLITNRNQKKAIEKERLKTQEEERQNKIMATLKAELEVQVGERTAELTSQKEELEHALTVLTATQSQLIQSEKMASLGELTAGIAHEIQNPLNFVNNFSELNSELITEMKEALNEGNITEAKIIADDINNNEQKIIFHGKRADAIVKGMLQHSRSSNGIKEPTNINALADEYLRLAYHGLRAKDKSFNATLNTDFDGSIGNIDIIPQDIGRVILNLITNAFYAVTEKKKQMDDGYEPTVNVSTALKPAPVGGSMRARVLISVKDNGNGIPQDVVDKIFQPFFTTKPTGQGTGLGLSMSYDIVTKGHGGELKVETKEGEGTAFIINLPV
ncbi:MAG: histidine kinase [Ferruginibacter sp.]|nr:histidine kinase [Ferruginibacter sp.]